MSVTLQTIATLLAEELLRGHCRTSHKTGEPCKRCDALALFYAHVPVVQIQKARAQAALMAVADRPGERSDG